MSLRRRKAEAKAKKRVERLAAKINAGKKTNEGTENKTRPEKLLVECSRKEYETRKQDSERATPAVKTPRGDEKKEVVSKDRASRRQERNKKKREKTT